MARLRSRCYVHIPTPPFHRIAGPIFPSSTALSWGLSEASTGRLTVAGDDIKSAYLEPGMCWLIDNSDWGEPPWAGFIEEQQLPLNADSLNIDLIGPKKALLSIEFAVRLPVNATRAYAVQQALEAAQLRHGGIFPGIIDPSEGPAIPLDVRGETISAFIDTLHNESGGNEWRERVEILGDGEELIFYLDFGTLKTPTSIVLGRRDMTDGLFTRKRVPTSMTLVGESYGFENRPVATTSIDRTAGASEPAIESATTSAIIQERLRDRNIGPASVYHKTIVSERVKGDLVDYARQRHVEILQALDEMLLTIDMTKASGQRIRLGDVIAIDIIDWGKPLNRLIDEKLHVIRTEVNSVAGTKLLLGRVTS